MTEDTQTKPATKRPRRMAREPKSDAAANAPTADTPPAKNTATPAKAQTKASLVEAMLMQEAGVSLDELCQATSWLPHTCRAFLTGLRKKGKVLERSKREDGATIYKLAAVAADGAGEEPATPEATA